MQEGQDIDPPGTQEPSLVALPKHPETRLGQCVVQKEQEAPSEPTGDQMQVHHLLRSRPEQRRNGCLQLKNTPSRGRAIDFNLRSWKRT